jgi:Flp pilus assembly protein TadG
MHRDSHDDSGAAAVEFALVLPILLVLVFGIIDFGRAYFTQNGLSNSARETVRVVALRGTDAASADAVIAAASATIPTDDIADIEVAVDGVAVAAGSTLTLCTVGEPVTVTITEPFDFLTPLPGLAGFTGIDQIVGKGVMRCGG